MGVSSIHFEFTIHDIFMTSNDLMTRHFELATTCSMASIHLKTQANIAVAVADIRPFFGLLTSGNYNPTYHTPPHPRPS